MDLGTALDNSLSVQENCTITHKSLFVVGIKKAQRFND